MGSSNSRSSSGKGGCKPFVASKGYCKGSIKKVKGHVYHSLKIGDLIRIYRKKYGYWHWVVYIGDNLAIHVTTVEDDDVCQCPDEVKFGSQNRTPICPTCKKYYHAVACCDAFDAICDGDYYEIDNSLDKKHRPLPADKIAKRAKFLLGPVNYGIFKNNCEHFATFCRNNKAVCGQSTTGYSTADSYLKDLKKEKWYQACMSLCDNVCLSEALQNTTHNSVIYPSTSTSHNIATEYRGMFPLSNIFNILMT